MRLEHYIDTDGKAGISGLFFACGSFGVLEGKETYTCEKTGNKTVFRHETDALVLTAAFTETEHGVFCRKDTLLAKKPLEINDLLSRFCMVGDAYDVYTQFNGWQHESSGGWQPLVTQVTAAAQGMRGCDSAAPMLALHDRYSGKNTVFHLMPNAQWQMTARKFFHNDREIVLVETGFNGQGLRLRAEAGETVELPTLFFFQAESKTDLDAWKLHTVYNRLYPRKPLPVIYNSWLYCFDRLNIDDLLRQAELAAELGFEAFMIDAGWFGNGDSWSRSVGDWEENTVSGPKGRLTELSERVRELGMRFGLWFEPERATPQSKAVTAHPEYYINDTFLDFANPDARAFILEKVAGQIEKYQLGWVKFDFNVSLPHDPSGNGFYRYLKGQKAFIAALKNRFPDLYISCCAGGGYRMELEQGSFCDSFWFTDNQGPWEGIEIVKNTLKRMPTALIERWNVQKYCEGFSSYGNPETIGRMLSCNNATWDHMILMKDSFIRNFLVGGPMGWTCDLDVPHPYKTLWAEWIAEHKKNREFYRTATARILADDPNLTVIQYADPALSRIVLQVFTKTTHARELMLYPVLKKDATYGGQSGAELMENGIKTEKLEQQSCLTIELRED